MCAADVEKPGFCATDAVGESQSQAAAPEERSRAFDTAPASLPTQLAFFERFLDERSIKWMLGLGMLTLLASSLKFVTDHWESYSPFWKYLVLIAYTAVMYAGAEISLHRLALKRTGTGLLALTLALLPMTFFALRWVAPGLPTDVFGLLHDVGLAALLAVNIGFTACASRRILKTLLREVPATYWLSYLALCVAGALLPAVPASLAPFAALVLWAVFTAGVVKVNRHVFWLAEAERWPRIFPFFPTALLAAQFATLFVLNFASSISPPWIGFGLVLVAAPVLLTADAVAAVFQQRTGKIVFPWPAEIVLPMVIGLGCCAAGMGLALTDLPRPVAFVPTALLAALCVGAVARRTGHQAFAWAMLFCLLGAYQFSPVYFLDLARQVVHQSAVAVHEQRLPYAFYGITYAPFILGLAVAGRWLKSPTFAVPCRQLAIALCALMLVASWTHPKAIFISGMTLTALWTVLRFAQGNRHLLWGAGTAWISVAFGLEAFLRDVCLVPTSTAFTFWAVTGAAAVLWLIDRGMQMVNLWRWSRACSSSRCGGCTIPAWAMGPLINDSSSRIPRFAIGPLGRPFDFADTLRGGPLVIEPLEFISVATAVLMAAGWFVQFGMTVSTAGTGAAMATLLLLAVHQRQRSYPLLGELVLLLAGWTALRYGIAMHLGGEALLLSFVAVTATLWAVARALEPASASLTVSAFRLPALRVTTLALVLTQLLVLIALTFFSHGQPDSVMVLLAAGTVTLWGFVAAGRWLPVAWVHAACVSLLLVSWRALCYAVTEPMPNDWLPVLWATMSVAGSILAKRITRTGREAATRSVGHAVDRFAATTLFVLTCVTLPWLSISARLAGAIAIATLAMRVRNEPTSLLRHALLEAGFLHVLGGLLSTVTNASNLDDVSVYTWHTVHLPGIALAAAWLMTLQSQAVRRFLPSRELLDAETWLWRVAVFGGLGLVPFLQPVPLTALKVVALLASFALLVGEQFRLAARKQDVESVWCGMWLVAVAIGYLTWFRVIEPTGVVPLGIGIATGVMLSAIGRGCRRHVATVVFAGPFEQVGYWLPAAMAIVAALGSVREAASVLTGAYSLIVFAAAACYFIRWIERREPASLVIATVIFNTSQMLLWNELRWFDPQLYLMPLGLSLIALVEGLSRELNSEWKTTLRYAGALVILVSPLFHILDGGWLPLLTLMAASLAVSLLAIGLKTRPLLYSGAAFLVANLVAMVVRGGMERADVLWAAGIGLGTAVVALAAYCENHREIVLQRVRLVAATLQTWD